jgi:D-aminopeptidase
MPQEPIPAGTEKHSIIIIVATDAPLLPDQLDRLAKRATIGLARVGGIGEATSGDLFLAFSTANPLKLGTAGPTAVSALSPEGMTPLFAAVADATAEEIVNALVAAPTMRGATGVTVYGLPKGRVRAILAKYGRLTVPFNSSHR